MGSTPIVRHILKIDRVTFEQVCGTLCVYMLIGLIWAEAYSLIGILLADQFSAKASGLGDYLYFSFVTLTTLGYGDIIPVGPVARSFAVVEAIIGQFFLAVLVARQVGLYISQNTH
ncbi:MAG: ion channel [Pseudomonadota bacterium]